VIVLAQNLHASPFVIGLIFALGGVGAIIGALSATFIQRRFSFPQVIIGATWISAILLPFYAIAPNVVVLGLLLGMSFLTGPIYNVVQMSYRMAIIPDELQGRVNSIFRLIAFGGQPLGLALTGILIQRIGVVSTVLLCAVVMAVFAVAATLNTHVRHARPLVEMPSD
jgi:predicted MFS family arabinose efflux permease